MKSSNNNHNDVSFDMNILITIMILIMDLLSVIQILITTFPPVVPAKVVL